MRSFDQRSQYLLLILAHNWFMALSLNNQGDQSSVAKKATRAKKIESKVISKSCSNSRQFDAREFYNVFWDCVGLKHPDHLLWIKVWCRNFGCGKHGRPKLRNRFCTSLVLIFPHFVQNQRDDIILTGKKKKRQLNHVKLMVISFYLFIKRLEADAVRK